MRDLDLKRGRDKDRHYETPSVDWNVAALGPENRMGHPNNWTARHLGCEMVTSMDFCRFLMGRKQFAEGVGNYATVRLVVVAL
jgi:hypothetical protein